MKFFLLILFFVNLVFADENSVDIDYDVLYTNIQSDDSNLTKNTIEQYVKSAFNVHAHDANYFLPISYRFDDNFENVKDERNQPKQVEVEFQVSIKFDMASNILGLNEIYTIGYTQLSYWQLYTTSAYFRESNYNPEFFITLPISSKNEKYAFKGMRFGFAHESNGQGLENERSWNFLYTSLYAQIGKVFVDLRGWIRLEDNIDYNPDLLDYMGHGHLKLILPYKKHMLQTTFRYGKESKLTSKVTYSYPVFGRDDLFLYIKGFSGYGESLIDYNNKVDKLAIGFSISR